MSAAAPVTSPTTPGVGVEPLGPLAGRLQAADRRLQIERGGTLFFRAWPWLAGAIVLALTLDVIFHLPPVIRLLMDLVGGLLLAGGAACCAWIAWRKQNTFEHTARILESRHARLGSKLINLLQLRAQTQDPALSPLTRDLARLAVEGYSAELIHEPIEQLARTRQLTDESKRAGLGLLGLIALLGLLFDITRTELPRFFDPFGDHPPYSFTRLAIVDPATDDTALVYHQNLLVTAQSSGHRPGELFLSWFPAGHPEQTTTVPMFDKGERGFTQQIENISADLILFAHTKNQHAISHQRRVSVILTPKLQSARVVITPPAYTGLPPEDKAFNFKGVRALIGSTIEFRLTSNRPLSGGHLTVNPASGPVEPAQLAPRGENEVAVAIPAKENAQLKFSLFDRDGFESQENLESALTITHDLPPEIQISNPSSDSFAAMDFKAEPLIEASDDYGVKTVRIHVGRNGVFGEPRIVTPERITTRVRETEVLDFKSMGLVSGDKVSVFAEAIDTAPDPRLARSKTITFTVITTEEYNDFLRERTDMADLEAKYSQLVNQLHDLVEQQKKLGEEAAQAEKQLAAAKTDAERAAAEKKLADLLAKQAALNEQLNRLADTMENFVRDQPLYDLEADLKDTLAKKAQEIRDSTSANQEANKEASQQLADQASGQKPSDSSPVQAGQSKAGSQPSLSPEMLEQFQKASAEQLARLGATEQSTREQVEQPLADLSLVHEIMKDLNRIKDLYTVQEELAKQSKAYDRETPLSREDQLALKDLAAQQKAVGEELDTVEQKLWEDGQAAKEKFPKASESARTIAQRMGDLKLQTLANQATREMLAGHGGQGSQLAETLRSEMEKLFSQCQGQEGDMSTELDQYLSLKRGLNARQNFKQMMQSRKFGMGFKPGMGDQGNGGKDGYAVYMGPNANVLGNESRPSITDHTPAGGQGKDKAPSADAKPSVALDKPDVVEGVNAVNRQSEAVQGETTIEQYSDLVEKYFKSLTKKPQPAKP